MMYSVDHIALGFIVSFIVVTGSLMLAMLIDERFNDDDHN